MAQREYGGYLSGPAIAEVAFRLNRSYAEVEGVATFYSMYNTAHSVGKHMIEVCTCLTCQVCDAYPIAEYLKKKLGIGFGETTADGLFTLHEVECLNACDRAPLLQVGDEYHGPVDEAYVDRMIEDLRTRERSSVTQLADEIVQVHLAQHETPWRDWTPNLTDTYYGDGVGAQAEKPKPKKAPAKKPATVAEEPPSPQATPDDKPTPPTKGRITVDDSA